MPFQYSCFIYGSIVIGLSADTTDKYAPYGGCEYIDAEPDVLRDFWGCGIPGKNEMDKAADLNMNKFTADTGCGNDLVRFFSFCELVLMI